MADYVASRGTTALGIIGTALGSLGVLGGNVFGMGAAPMGYGYGCGRGEGDQFVTRYELDMERRLANKDSEIALLKSEQNTEIKIADVYERLITRINADRNAQSEINTHQAVLNATQNSVIGCLQRQIDQLQGMTRTVIPNSSICPGWGDVNVTPVTPTTPAAGT